MERELLELVIPLHGMIILLFPTTPPVYTTRLFCLLTEMSLHKDFLFPNHNIDTKYIPSFLGIHGTHCNSPSVTNTLLCRMFKLCEFGSKNG